MPLARESAAAGMPFGALAEQVCTAVTSVPGVAAMHAGRFGEVATHLPGRRVVGVQLRPDHVEIHITVAWEADLLQVADAVRAAAGRVTSRPVDVVVEDVRGPSESIPAVPR